MNSMEQTRFKKKHSELILRLTRKLHFSYPEVETILIVYYKLQKDGAPKQPGINKNQFRDVMHSTFDMTDNSLFDRIFLAMDKGPTPYVSMETWVAFLSLFLRGSLDEKIDFCFAIQSTIRYIFKMHVELFMDTTMDSMEQTRFKKKYSTKIARLTKRFHFTYTEVETIMIIYYKMNKKLGAKQPGVNKIQFGEVLHSTFDMTDDSLFDRIFLAMDKGHIPYVTMDNWVKILSLFLRGTIEEKIDFCFSVYDLMGDGMLGRETMFQLLRTSMVSQSSEEDAEESVKDMIEVLTKKMDLDRDGKISYDDYRQTVISRPMLLECFGQCLPSREAVNAFLTTFTHKVGKL